jgi:hypothetical protein
MVNRLAAHEIPDSPHAVHSLDESALLVTIMLKQ